MVLKGDGLEYKAGSSSPLFQVQVVRCNKLKLCAIIPWRGSSLFLENEK